VETGGQLVGPADGQTMESGTKLVIVLVIVLTGGQVE